MKFQSCLLFAAFWICCAHLDAQPSYRFQHFDTNDGLASDLAKNIIQDSLGFLWIQYPEGLTRYDGYNFKVYHVDPEDPERSPTIPTAYDMMLDASGDLWIPSGNPGPDYVLTKYDKNVDGFIQYKAPLIGSPFILKTRFEKGGNAVWIATSNGLYYFNISTNEIKNYVNHIPDSLTMPMSNHIFDIIIYDSLVLLATKKGLWEFDKTKKTFSRPRCDPKDSDWLYNDAFFTLFDERKFNSNDIWLVDGRAFYKVNKNLSIIQRLDLPGGRSGVGVMGFDRDKEGVFWIGTWDKGVCRYDPADSSIVFIKNKPGDPNSLRADRINDVMIDRDQNIWVTTFRGISRLQRQHITFYNSEISGGDINLSTVYQSGGNDYVIIDKNDGGEHHIMMAPIILSMALNFKQIVPPFRGPQGNGFWRGKRNFWITVWGVGVVSVPINSISGMIEYGPLKMLSHHPENPYTISSNFTTSPWEDPEGNLWVGTTNGLNKVAPDILYGTPGSVVHYNHVNDDSTSLIDDHVLHFSPEDENSFWLSTLTGVDLYSNNQFEHFFTNNRQPTIIHKSAEGILFIGTRRGLYEGVKSGGKYKFSKSRFLKNTYIIAIHEDPLGRLWISTRQGIVCYDRKEPFAIEFNDKDGFLHKRMAHGGFRPNLSSAGIMVISDYSGLTLFKPLTLQVNRKKTSPLLTRLIVNNQVITVEAIGQNKNTFLLKKDISVLNELILDHQRNNFTLEFSSMDFTSPEKNLYRHKLEGYDEDWIETDYKSRTATYTNLDAGSYVFKVRASNYHGIWNDNETNLTVIILPPPWKTWWAYSMYGLAFVMIFLYWRSYEIKRVRLKQRAKHLTELDNLKTRFFTNISHEFRTPITLILGPLKEIYHKTTNADQKTTFGAMLRNGQRLLRLINQLLDLSKIEAGKMQLHTSPSDLVEFLREIVSAYESLAKDKKIKYFFYPEVQELVVYIDQEKIEKVIHNLLSNAFKFTKEEGEVILNLKTEKNQCVITVKDSGIGIPLDQVDKVFDRFYQVDSSHTRGYEGSGLGMALAKELVDLHKGKISVDSKEGKGTTFTVSLPLGKDHLRKEEITDAGFKKSDLLSDVVISEETRMEIRNENETVPVNSQPVLLIVEDNADMRHYIRKTLSDEYQILEAENGKKGVEKANESIPDLIISDIMMPEMDGFKLCEIIKTNELTSHIPVILLTAKADRESKLTGLETGADDYLSKPFDAAELKLIIRNRIAEREKMREGFSREITLEPKHISITSLDEKFLAKLLAIIETRMDDEGFSIDELSREAGFSNIHFYRKIKALSGQPPNQFLRTIRLKRAAELLRNKSDNVSQIAYSVGFSSQSYFIKCFKEQFGVTPGQFVEESKRSKV